MSPVPPDDLPRLSDDARAVADDLRAGLERVLGENLASLFLYGAVAFPRPAHWRIDFDFHVLLNRPPGDRERAGIGAVHDALRSRSELGRDLDGYYVLLADARLKAAPRHQLDRAVRDGAWALHRAHIRAGRRFVIAGVDPSLVVPEPTWAELAAALRGEMRFVAAHPDATAYGILNSGRVLCSFVTRDVVRSKYQAGQWALASLPVQWHDGVRAALRWYERAELEGDQLLLADRWAPFVTYVRDALAATSRGRSRRGARRPPARA